MNSIPSKLDRILNINNDTVNKTKKMDICEKIKALFDDEPIKGASNKTADKIASIHLKTINLIGTLHYCSSDCNEMPERFKTRIKASYDELVASINEVNLKKHYLS